jgi:hypothetical protein
MILGCHCSLVLVFLTALVTAPTKWRSKVRVQCFREFSIAKKSFTFFLEMNDHRKSCVFPSLQRRNVERE